MFLGLALVCFFVGLTFIFLVALPACVVLGALAFFAFAIFPLCVDLSASAIEGSLIF